MDMVNLGNPYPPLRPRPAAFVPLVLLFVLGYGIFKFNIFSFLYRYTLMMAVLVFVASLFDSELLSQRRLLALPGRNGKWKVFLGTATLVMILLYISERLLPGRALVLDFYRRGSGISLFEQLSVMVLVVSPLEEVFLRGYGQLNIMNLLGRSTGLVISSVVYGIFFMLGGGWILAVKFTLLNLYFGFIYSRTGSLPVVIAFRAAITLLIVLVPM